MFLFQRMNYIIGRIMFCNNLPHYTSEGMEAK
jgi:hypothetical protein